MIQRSSRAAKDSEAVRAFRTIVLASVLLASLLSCQGDPSAPGTWVEGENPTTILLSASRLALVQGDTFRLTTAVVWTNGQAAAAPIIWSSSAPNIASVSSSGLVTAADSGDATITATTGTLSQSAHVSVKKNSPDNSDSPADIIVTPSSTELAAGDTVRLEAAVIGRNGKLMPSTARVNWSSSAPDVATVDGDGLVRGRRAGSATITASTNNVKRDASVAVRTTASTPSPDAPASITLVPASLGVATGDTARLVTEVRNASGQLLASPAIEWSSSATQVATVDAAGLVRGVSEGDAVIIATAGTVSEVAEVHVAKASPPPPEAEQPASISVTPESLRLQVDDTARVTATVLGGSGQPLATQPEIAWSSSKTSVATVNASGLVKAVAAGTAIVTAAVGDVAQTLEVTVEQAPPPPADEPASIVLKPASLELAPQDTASLAATVIGKSGDPITGLTLSWTSSDTAVAKVNSSGRVTAIGSGSAAVTAAVGSVKKAAAVTVTSPAQTPPPPSGSEWDRVLADTTINGHVVVPDGQRWLIGRNVQIAGNLRTVNGTIAMRPGSTLKFLGADPEKYVGGGMHYDNRVAGDIGLWVGGPGATGKLDISCTPKKGWNRTGTHPTWRADDEYWITPTDPGDYEPRRWYPGNPIPRVHQRAPAAEVINVTRDCVIEGPGHIFISASAPQRIEYVELRRMGIFNRTLGTTTGRYALHLHMMGEAARGTVVRGVSSVDAGGRVFVPHTSHGVTMIDLVAVNSLSTGFWWDPGHFTNDLLVDSLVVAGVTLPRAISGSTSRQDAIVLGTGLNMEIRNSVASGARGSNLSVGFHWTTVGVHRDPAKWVFNNGNVAHNNEGPGIRFWFNDLGAHIVRNAVTYRNGQGGIENGAYGNAVRYADVLLIEDHVHHQTSARENDEGGEVSGYRNVEIYASRGPAFVTGHRKLEGSSYLEVINSVLVPEPGHPKVFVSARGETPFLANFRNSGMTPNDIVWETLTGGTDGSHVIIEHEDGRVWDLRVSSGKLNIRLR